MSDGQIIKNTLEKVGDTHDKKIYSDSERSVLWGLELTTIETLEEVTVPYCFNPENQRAVLVFDGGRRLSSVLALFNTPTTPITPKIIRSKKSILSFLADGEIEDMPTFFNHLQ